jgi:hypothetical protein
MKKVVWSGGTRFAAALMLIGTTAACGSLTRQGQSSSYLILQSLEAASGADPSKFGGNLGSDVITVVKENATVFSDNGQAQFLLALKDPGSSTSPNDPTANNFITIDRYHVTFVRSDGHNIEGVDVPYAFDGAATGTVGNESTTISFTLVRHQAKEEAPLRALRGNGLVLSTIAQVTFYGHDQTGRDVSVTGNIGVSFANFGDPSS